MEVYDFLHGNYDFFQVCYVIWYEFDEWTVSGG